MGPGALTGAPGRAMWEHASVRYDDTTEAPAAPSAASVRLFDRLGGVELGVRQTRRRAMIFVRVRKVVIALWWRAGSA